MEARGFMLGGGTIIKNSITTIVNYNQTLGYLSL